MSSERSSTIGQQRKFNYALKPMSKEQFVEMMCCDLPEAPAYFSAAVEKNKQGATALKELPKPEGLSCQRVEKETKDGVLVLDVRSGAQFGDGHIAGSMNLGLGGQFASWAGSLIPIGTRIILVTEDDAVIDEAVMRLARAGHESVIGYLAGGMSSWEKAGLPIVKTAQISADELKQRLSTQKELQVIDVRRPREYEGGHVPGAINIPLNELRRNLDKVEKTGQQRLSAPVVIAAVPQHAF
jgi:Rhodanese-related sulfurtransferase